MKKPRKASVKERRSLILQGNGTYIRDLNCGYPYDGHWPLTASEKLTQRVQQWYRENHFRYYATGVGPAQETDFIVLLANFAKEFHTRSRRKNL